MTLYEKIAEILNHLIGSDWLLLFPIVMVIIGILILIKR